MRLTLGPNGQPTKPEAGDTIVYDRQQKKLGIHRGEIAIFFEANAEDRAVSDLMYAYRCSTPELTVGDDADGLGPVFLLGFLTGLRPVRIGGNEFVQHYKLA